MAAAIRIGDDRYFDPAQVAVDFATRPLVDMAAKCTIPDAGDRRIPKILAATA